MHRLLPPLLALLVATTASAEGFHALGLPGSQLAALSADGRTGVGGVIGAASGGFRWHEGAAPQWLERAVSVRAVSASGRYAAGSSLDAQQREVATWWDAAGASHALGGLTGAEAIAGVLSAAWGIDDDAQVVGIGANGGDTVAVRWSARSGWQVLDAAPGAAIGISNDGRRVYGWIAPAGEAHHAAMWSDGRSWRARTVAGARDDELVGANRAATIVLGAIVDSNLEIGAYRWIPPSGAVERLASAVRFTASSDDGGVLVGFAGSGAQRVAMIRTRDRGVERLRDLLASRAIDVPSGWSLLAATAVSAEGGRVGGFGLVDGQFDSFVIDLGNAPATPSDGRPGDRHARPVPALREPRVAEAPASSTDGAPAPPSHLEATP
ncbi:MAG TPA: hypothetical protein VFS55_14110 [Dokdonella sp.]|nr:hypothetical protein [Dokdonella sp.]